MTSVDRFSLATVTPYPAGPQSRVLQDGTGSTDGHATPPGCDGGTVSADEVSQRRDHIDDDPDENGDDPCTKTQHPELTASATAATTATGTAASSGSVASVLTPQLISEVRRRTCSRRRADYVEALDVLHAKVTRIPLSLGCDVDTAQAFRDASREQILLNGVCFVGDHRTEAFVAAVKRIVARHVTHADRYISITDRIMRGCSRTLSGSDSYFALHELFACPEMLIKPRQAQHTPLDVTLGRDYADDHFKCRIKSTNLFGLYRTDDIERLLLTDKDEIDPFVAIDTLVVELIDLTTEESKRHLSIRTPLTAPSKLDLEIDELF